MSKAIHLSNGTRTHWPACGLKPTFDGGDIQTTTDRTAVTCPKCLEHMRAGTPMEFADNLRKDITMMARGPWSVLPAGQTVKTMTAGETIYSGEAVFIDSDGLVRLTDREEAARRNAAEIVGADSSAATHLSASLHDHLSLCRRSSNDRCTLDMAQVTCDACLRLIQSVTDRSDEPIIAKS